MFCLHMWRYRPLLLLPIFSFISLKHFFSVFNQKHLAVGQVCTSVQSAFLVIFLHALKICNCKFKFALRKMGPSLCDCELACKRGAKFKIGTMSKEIAEKIFGRQHKKVVARSAKSFARALKKGKIRQFSSHIVYETETSWQLSS